MANLIHVCLFALDASLYWEWVPSKSNWADAISRLGFQDPWPEENQFSVHMAYFPFELWNLPVAAAIQVVQYL